MSCFTAWIAFLILIGSVWSQKEYSEEEFPVVESGEDLARFGFDLLDPIRKSFCDSYCKSSDTMPYLTNLACAVKCPELYLPHGQSSSTMKSSDKPTTEPSSTTSSTPSSTLSSSKAPQTPPMSTLKPNASMIF